MSDLELWEKIATPSRFATTVGKEFLGVPYIAYPWVLEVERRLMEAVMDPEERFIILNVPPQNGKALDVDTPIATPNGWKRIGDIIDGDLVYTHDGTLCSVTKAHAPYATEIWRVTFDDKSTIDCDEGHLWTAYQKSAAESYAADHRTWQDDWPTWRAPGQGKRRRDGGLGRGAETLTTRAIAQSLHVHCDDRANWRIPVGRIVGQDVDLPIDPYLLGYWLGDGSTSSGGITVGLSDLAALIERVGESRVRHYRSNPSTANVRPRGLERALRLNGLLNNKHIPAAYLRSSVAQRRALLAGLMDSDGGMSGNTAEISQQDAVLADGIQELVVSLGGKVRAMTRPAALRGKLTGKTVYRQAILTDFNPFSLPRKADKWEVVAAKRRRLKRSQRTIQSVEPTGRVGMVRCLTVDAPSRLYLAGRSMIPTHNTTLMMFLIGWYLGMFPERQVIFVAYAAEYAESWGLKTRNLMDRYGRDLFGHGVSTQRATAGDWKMDNGFGGMLSVGIGGGITGNPGHLIVIDDVIKTMEEAASPTTKRKHLAEYDGAISSRFQPGTTVVACATRFAEDDLSGSLIERCSVPGYQGEQWEVIAIPAIAEPPESLELSPEELAIWTDFLGRSAGQALQGRYSQKFYERRRGSLDPYTWSAVYQQNPSVPEGGMFPKGNWRTWEELPRLGRTVRAWDLAATAGGGDWTVGTKMALGEDGDLYVLDSQRFQRNSAAVEQAVKDTALVDGYGVKILIEEEKAGAGRALVEHYQRLLSGYTVEPAKVDGAKEVRARPYSAMQHNRRVWLPASWTDDRRKAWVDEHKRMMGDGRRPRHDDQIDTAAYCTLELLGTGTSEMWIPGEPDMNDELAQLYAANAMMAGLLR